MIFRIDRLDPSGNDLILNGDYNPQEDIICLSRVGHPSTRGLLWAETIDNSMEHYRSFFGSLVTRIEKKEMVINGQFDPTLVFYFTGRLT
jgi:hypothetical protein